MHVKIVSIVLVYWLIFLCSETDQPFIVNVKAKWVATCYKGIDAHIELEAFVK